YGITLGQPVYGDMSAIALVKADGASDISIQNKTGVRTDSRGYAIIPYLSPYRKASIILNPDALSPNVELTEYAQNVVPTAGAVVLAKYKTNHGRRALMTLHYENKNVPFGATVKVTGIDDYEAIVGDDGEVFLSGLTKNGQVRAIWDNGSKVCSANYEIPDGTEDESGIILLNGECK
ncbi:fimbrial biogenesis outer membrane usher protein, partial [Enterobacter cloacae complex sp. P6RS]|uniref:fimbria/pilus outer membrane usher protein n=1 Tax=Enterobacter cloacae complex sp. P6RS TaxID=2779588 RepID=UPI00187390B9